MAQYRKTFFSLGGPEFIADPRDDVAMELGRQLLQRQQLQQGNRADQARLDLQRDAMGYQQQSDAQDRAMRLQEITGRQTAEQRRSELDRQQFEEQQRQARFGEGLAGQQFGLQQTAEQRRAADDARRMGLEQARFDRGVVESDRGFGLSERQMNETGRRYDEDRAARVQEEQLRDQRERDRMRLGSELEGQRESARDQRQARQNEYAQEQIRLREQADTEQRMGLAAAERDQTAQQQIAVIANEATQLAIPEDGDPEGLTTLAATVQSYFAPQAQGDPEKGAFWAPSTKQHVDQLERVVVTGIQQRFAAERSGQGKPPTNRGEWLPFGIVEKRTDELNRMEVVAIDEARRAADRARAQAIDAERVVGAHLARGGGQPRPGMGPMPSAPAPAGGPPPTAPGGGAPREPTGPGAWPELSPRPAPPAPPGLSSSLGPAPMPAGMLPGGLEQQLREQYAHENAVADERLRALPPIPPMPAGPGYEQNVRGQYDPATLADWQAARRYSPEVLGAWPGLAGPPVPDVPAPPPGMPYTFGPTLYGSGQAGPGSPYGMLSPESVNAGLYPRYGVDQIPAFDEGQRVAASASDAQMEAFQAAAREKIAREQAGLPGYVEPPPPLGPAPSSGFGGPIGPLSSDEYRQLAHALQLARNDESLRANMRRPAPFDMPGGGASWDAPPARPDPALFLEVLRQLYPEQFGGPIPPVSPWGRRELERKRQKAKKRK